MLSSSTISIIWSTITGRPLIPSMLLKTSWEMYACHNNSNAFTLDIVSVYEVCPKSKCTDFPMYELVM